MTAPEPEPTVTELLARLVDVGDRGVHFENSFVSWRDHIRSGAELGAALWARLDSSKPPHVGVLAGNTPVFSELLVAAALTGLVPVGLNPTRRGAALARDIDHADCQLVLSDATAGIECPGAIDVESPSWQRELAGFAGTPVVFRDSDSDDLFMLIFTSGTSGDPKAVCCTHYKAAFPGVMLAERLGLGPADTCYLSMPMFHSNAIMAGWAPAVAAGASIALRRKFSASQFIPDVRRYNATFANYVGKPLSYVLATPQRVDDADNPLRLLYGNEGAPRDLERFSRRFGAVVIDAFGSSEGGVAIARTPETPAGALGPLADGVTIVDVGTGRECPPGAVGELVNSGGYGQFRGYYNDPDAEAERVAGGIYHTGDLAYRDADGYAYFAGRLGDWMRVDGENLGTAPIERVLVRHPDVADAAVYAVPDPGVGDRVMAALVLTEGTEFDADEFVAFLADQPDLGPKQWPAIVRITTALPRTETFKVIKRQLAAEGTDCFDPVWQLRR